MFGWSHGVNKAEFDLILPPVSGQKWTLTVGRATCDAVVGQSPNPSEGPHMMHQ